MTLRPLGPRVTLTASASVSTPRIMRWRASPPKRTSFAAICWFLPEFSYAARSRRLFLRGRNCVHDAHDVRLLHDQEFLTVKLHFGAGPFPKQNAVTFLYLE